MTDEGPPDDREPSWLPQEPAPASVESAATRLLTRADTAAMLLRLVAGAGAVAWLITGASAFATQWHQLGGTEGFGSADSSLWRFLASLTLSLQSSSFYAIAAVIAFSASAWLSRERARDALDLLDEAD